MRLLAILLLCIGFCFAQESTCEKFCTECSNSDADICKQVFETCKCSFESDFSDSDNSSIDETVDSPKPLASTAFGEPKDSQNDGPLSSVDFGEKGDSHSTAVLQEDGSYKLQSKGQIWIAVSAIGTIVLVAILLAAL